MEVAGAERGRILLTAPDREPDDLEVIEARGGADDWRGSVSEPEQRDLVRYVLATGQPQALASSGVPAALAAPCVHGDEVVGVLELAGKVGGGRFTFDDMELVTLFGGIAAAALVGPESSPPPSPEQLRAELQRLAIADPAAYASMARTVQSLLYA
jgi:GAF domain-containing protein